LDQPPQVNQEAACMVSHFQSSIPRRGGQKSKGSSDS